MMRAMFAAISGMRTNQLALDVTANNIANVNTVGYKSSRTTFQDALSQNMAGAAAPQASLLGGINPIQVGLGVRLASVDNEITQGAIQQTGNPFDLAVQGSGWFQVSSDPTSATAPVFYTRAGNFTRDANGDLVTVDGFYLIGNTGSANAKINVPADARSVNIDPSGTVTVVPQTGSAITYKIQLARFPNEAGLQREGDNLWSATNNSGAAVVAAPQSPGYGAIYPGAVEMSNVDLASQFVQMITSQRGFQASSRVISVADELLQELVNLKR